MDTADSNGSDSYSASFLFLSKSESARLSTDCAGLGSGLGFNWFGWEKGIHCMCMRSFCSLHAHQASFLPTQLIKTKTNACARTSILFLWAHFKPRGGHSHTQARKQKSQISRLIGLQRTLHAVGGCQGGWVGQKKRGRVQLSDIHCSAAINGIRWDGQLNNPWIWYAYCAVLADGSKLLGTMCHS